MVGSVAYGGSLWYSMAMITTDEIEQMLRLAFQGAQIQVSDMTGTSDHFDIQITAKEFAGKSLIDQHKMVHEVLASEMEGRIHAVQIKTKVS